jgi:hypothetical protein
MNEKLYNIDVIVDLELCKLNISLGKLLSLKTGDIVTTDAIPSEVKLVVNNDIFAQGFLVDVQGKLGVRLTKIFEHQEFAPSDHSENNYNEDNDYPDNQEESHDSDEQDNDEDSDREDVTQDDGDQDQEDNWSWDDWYKKFNKDNQE